MRLTQAKGKGNITRLGEQTVQLQLGVPKPWKTATINPQQPKSEKDGNGNQCNTRGQGKNQSNGEGCHHKGIKCVQCDEWGLPADKHPSTPLIETEGR